MLSSDFLHWWFLPYSRHGQTTACTHHFTGFPSLGMSPGTLPYCSPSRISWFRRQMSLWTTSTLPVSSPMTTWTTSATVFRKKVLARKISSRRSAEYRQHHSSALQPCVHNRVEQSVRKFGIRSIWARQRCPFHFLKSELRNMNNLVPCQAWKETNKFIMTFRNITV